MNETLAPPPARRLRQIVAATDFSPASDHALARAALLAAEHGARLTLAHVVPASLWEDIGAQMATVIGVGPVSPQEAQDAAAGQLRRRAAELSERHRRVCDVAVAGGRPAAELARIATQGGADLLVIGAHGAHPVRALLVGTTAQKLLRVSPCPVLVVKRPPPFAYGRVLAPTDFSAPARAALQAAAALLPDARLHVAHAFELPYDGLMRHAAVSGPAVAQHRAQARERLLPQLEQWTSAAGIAPERCMLHVEHGYAPTRIDGWIDSLKADLAVLAAHGKSELEATLLGSVSLHTVLSAPCDVLLLRGPGYA